MRGPTIEVSNYWKLGCYKLPPKFISPTSSAFARFSYSWGGTWKLVHVLMACVLLVAMNGATVATGMWAKRNYILFIQFVLFCCNMECLGRMLQECTSIFMRLDAVLWKCQAHCIILQLFALPVSRISQILFFCNHSFFQTMSVRANSRGGKGAVFLSKLQILPSQKSEFL